MSRRLATPLIALARIGGQVRPRQRGPRAQPLRVGRRVVRVTGGALVTLLLLGGGWLWLRDSSLVAIQQVRITGVSGPRAAALRGVLTRAARAMTTMDLSVPQLNSAVARFAVVGALRVHADFPHGLRIAVIERLPVAELALGGQPPVAVAAVGTLLPGSSRAGLPVISTRRAPSGPRLADQTALASVAVAAAAPGPLRGRLARVFVGARGLTGRLSSGTSLIFGDAARLKAKWIAAARVLADASSQGASYVDVTVPDRPVAAVAGAASLLAQATSGVVAPLSVGAAGSSGAGAGSASGSSSTPPGAYPGAGAGAGSPAPTGAGTTPPAYPGSGTPPGG